MGRRIPKTRRHKKLKAEPSQFGSQLRALPPKNDEQNVPQSSRDVVLLAQQEARAPIHKKRTGNRKNKFKRKSWESDGQFLARVSRETHEFVQEQAMKVKYEMKRNEPQVSGDEGSESSDESDVEAVRMPKKLKAQEKQEELELQKSTQKKGKLPKKNPEQRKEDSMVSDKPESSVCTAPKLFSFDVVTFGERVDAPPKIESLPRKCSASQTQKPGQRDLLLKECLKAEPAHVSQFKDAYKTDRTIKCKDPAKERVLTKEREKAIELYRRLKSKRKGN